MAKVRIKIKKWMLNLFFLAMFIDLWFIVVLPELRTMSVIFFIVGFIAYWFLSKKAKLNKDIRLGTNLLLGIIGLLVVLSIFMPESRDASFIFVSIAIFSYMFISRKGVASVG